MSTITFSGNLAADPELRFTPSGNQVANLTVLENRRRQDDRTGEWSDLEPNRYRVQVWGSTAVNIIDSARKGDRVVVVGTIVTDRWADKDTGEARTGQHVKATEVGFSLKYHTVKATKATRSAARESDDTDDQ
ncbi:MAG: single-stranded DNA-binding protein [Nocardioides sp.]